MLLFVATANAACPSGPAAVQGSVDRAFGAFASLDEAGFESARAGLERELDCLEAPLAPELVAQAHAVAAVAAVLRKDDAAAAAALRSARSAYALYNLPSAVPEGHRLWTMLKEVTPGVGPTETLQAPSGTRPVVDGQASATRPTDRPTVVWLEDAGGRVVWSQHLAPAEPVPDLSSYTVATPEPAPKVSSGGGSRVRLPLVVASAASAVATGTMFLLAGSSAGRFAATDTPYEDLDGLRSRANAFTVAGGAGIGVTVALGAATVLATEPAAGVSR